MAKTCGTCKWWTFKFTDMQDGSVGDCHAPFPVPAYPDYPHCAEISIHRATVDGDMEADYCSFWEADIAKTIAALFGGEC